MARQLLPATSRCSHGIVSFTGYSQHLHGALRNNGTPHSRGDSDHFLAHINKHHPSIKFTMETKQNNSIPFLDILFTKSSSGKPAHQVYRKPTHTDRYLHYRSFHHPSVLQSVSNALIRRAHQLSDADHLDQEIQHVTTVLTTINKYPRHKIKNQLQTPEGSLHHFMKHYPMERSPGGTNTLGIMRTRTHTIRENLRTRRLNRLNKPSRDRFLRGR
ncbi:uncharacterized protein LOC115929475 [Strongylocentrotus purpuratus]|uniref:Helix-turn-helix domain-containing protein n=1 Tax=Strongylocentrotus purpuratus TaxID=7668 RepID=A0A7M7PR60_STRPU|nr:uncharacterized protein LOC115929475 [Strongylocentrotus purpuratus]